MSSFADVNIYKTVYSLKAEDTFNVKFDAWEPSAIAKYNFML